ncbi:MAG TPA: hypothetical protein VF223_10840 [Trebonia sp.]
MPNSCATLYLPTAIFDFEVRPSADGPIAPTATAAQ